MVNEWNHQNTFIHYIIFCIIYIYKRSWFEHTGVKWIGGHLPFMFAQVERSAASACFGH